MNPKKRTLAKTKHLMGGRIGDRAPLKDAVAQETGKKRLALQQEVFAENGKESNRSIISEDDAKHLPSSDGSM